MPWRCDDMFSVFRYCPQVVRECGTHILVGELWVVIDYLGF